MLSFATLVKTTKIGPPVLLTRVFATVESHWKAGSTSGEVAQHHVDTVWKTAVVWPGAVHRIQDHMTLRENSEYIISERQVRSSFNALIQSARESN